MINQVLLRIAVRDNFEFDKIVWAVSLAVFIFIFSDNFGNIFYAPVFEPAKRGFEIEITDDTSLGAQAPSGLPEQIDMHAVMSQADAKLGEMVFRKCSVCHTADKNGVNKVGPNLWNIVDSVTAHRSDFVYSSAMKSRAEENLKWDYETLYRYLYSPKKLVKGTKMAFAGLKNDEDRANLIAYLRTLSDHPKPLP